MLDIWPFLFKPLEQAYFRSPGSTKRSREDVAKNDFQDVVTTADVDKLTTKGFLNEDTSSLVNASIGRCIVSNTRPCTTLHIFHSSRTVKQAAACSLPVPLPILGTASSFSIPLPVTITAIRSTVSSAPAMSGSSSLACGWPF